MILGQGHELKTEVQYFNAVTNGDKTFELRKNDRGFKIGDYIWLNQVDNGEYTGKRCGPWSISYILEGPLYGLQEGYCILQLKKTPFTRFENEYFPE